MTWGIVAVTYTIFLPVNLCLPWQSSLRFVIIWKYRPATSLMTQKQAINKGAARKKTKASLNAKIKSLRSAVSTLYVDLKDGLLTDEEYLMQKEKYQVQIAELEHTLGELNRDETDTEETLIGTKRWAAIAEEYSDATELSEGMLNACVELIKVHADGSLEITFNYMELLETTERLKKEVA